MSDLSFADQRRWTTVICVLLIVFFAVLSWSAVATKNSTIDEPLHAVSGWVALRHDDFRLVPESPSLWQCWAALPNIGLNLITQFDGKVWSNHSFDSQGGINWTSRTLYLTPGNDGEALVRRSRAMMMVPGILLGGMIGLWSFRLAGGVAAITAVFFFSFDPNFLAHAPIVKSDVPFALEMLVFMQVLWSLGRCVNWTRMVAIGVVCGLAVNTKFSGLLLPQMLGLLLIVRSLIREPWGVFGTVVHTFKSRLLVATLILMLTGVVVFGVTWASYGFRFRPAPAVDSQMDMDAIRQRAILLEAAAGLGLNDPTPQQIKNWKPSLIIRAIDFANEHRMLPQAMLGGLLYQHACLQVWPSYLLGRLYGIAPWYYYPLAMLFKTPLATLVAITLSAVVLVISFQRWYLFSWPIAWSAICLLVPFGIFMIAAMQSNLAIGLRSLLPAYPFLFVMIGVVASQAIKRWRRKTLIVMTGLAFGLLAEALPAWPNYISFFNNAAARNRFFLLGDSNLDWGQDLKPLVDWQKTHSQVPLYLHYFGTTNPEFLGLRYHTLRVSQDGRHLSSNVPLQSGMLAVSTNYLQGLYNKKSDGDFYRQLGRRMPDEIVGGSIYLYRFPLR